MVTPRVFGVLLTACLLLTSCGSERRRAPDSEIWNDESIDIPLGSMQDLIHLSVAAVGNDGNIRSFGKGWLFHPYEVLATIIEHPRYKRNLPVFVASKKELARYGMDYLVVLVPGNSTIYPDALNPEHPMSKRGLPYRIDLHRLELFKEFEDAGIDYIDLTPAFIRARLGKNADSRLKANSHWSCVGRVIAAQAIADWIRARPWAAEIPPASGKLDAVWEKETTSSVEPSMEEFMTINSLVAEDVAQTLYRRSVSGWRNGGSEAVIQVTGDSHVTSESEENESFAAQLAYELQSDVSNMGALGNWAFNSLANEYRTKPAEFMKRRIVIHVVSTRSFAIFDPKYHPIFPGSIDVEELKSMPDRTKDIVPVVVEATCTKMSTTRNLAQLKPYDSSLTCSLFRIDRVISGEYSGKEIAVAGWNIVQKEHTTWQRLVSSNRSYRFELDPMAMHPYLKKVAKDFDVLAENMDADVYWCRDFYELGVPHL
jgi:hypothetical protein